MRKLFLVFFLMLSFSISATAQEIQVEAGADAISTALADAYEGDVLILSTDGGVYTESATITIVTAVTIRAADGLAAMPIWTTSGDKHITLQNNLSLKGIIFDGAGKTTYAIANDAKNSDVLNVLKVDGCEFRNFVDAAIYKEGDDPDLLSIIPYDSVIVSNSLFHDCSSGVFLDGDHPSGGGQHDDNVPGAKYLSVENSTFYNMTSGWDKEDSAIKLEAYLPPGEPVFVNINHVTVNNCKHGLFLKELNVASTVHNNIVTNCITGVRIKYGPSSFTVSYNNVWKNKTDYTGDSGANISVGDGSISSDPMYADVANGDFTLLEGSPCIGTASDGQNMGDLRWAATGVDDFNEALPTVFSLSQNYPNPFNPSTTISYSIEKPGFVILDVYSITGQKVRMLVNNIQGPGAHSVVWDGCDDQGRKVADGIYFYRLQSLSSVGTKKMVLMK